MANSLYDLGREKFLNGDIDWTNDDIKVILVDTNDYTVNLATDEFLSDVTVAGIISTSGNLTGKTTTAGVADADDVSFTAVTGDELEAAVIYKDTGVGSTSPLIAYIDTASGFPVTPDGSNIDFLWDSGPNKIFKL